MAVPKVEGSAWVRRLHPAPAPRRLICFPHAGGAASYFAPLARALATAEASAAVDVLALQYPGRQERLSEPCIDSIEGLRDAILPELEGWLDRPFALFGHSMGAIVAFEVARVLERELARGPRPIGLFVSGRRAPATRRDEHVHRGGDPSLLREVARLAGTPTELLEDDDVREIMLPALRGDYRAIESYAWQPGPPLRCPIWALVGEADPLTTRSEAAAWGTHTTGAFVLQVFPGAHFYFVDQLAEVAAVVASALAGG